MIARQSRACPNAPPRAPRAEPREIVELRQLKLAQPELAAAVDMQIALVEMQRRVQARVPLPWIQPDPTWLAAQQAAGRPAVRFGDIPLDWTDFRLTLRQTADILRRYEALERAEHEQIVALTRDGNALGAARHAVVSRDVGRRADGPTERTPAGSPPSLDQVLRAGAAAVPGALRRVARRSASISPSGGTATVRSAAGSPTSRSSRRAPTAA